MLAVYIVWHPNYSKGSDIAELIRGHFRDGRYKNVLGDIGLSVIFRSSPVPDAETPLDIDLDEAETTAIIVLAESVLAGDAAWRKYVDRLIHDAEAKGLAHRCWLRWRAGRYWSQCSGTALGAYRARTTPHKRTFL